MKLLLAFAIASSLSFGDLKFGGRYQGKFPMGPDERVTPGSLCSRPDTHRYPEKIAYCSRNVESSLKWAIIRDYDKRFGYQIESMDRGHFKIDHYIPLCMGGSNDRDNLWPQHRSVYELTDLIEQRACELMAAGKMSQAEGIDTIKHVKNHLDDADKVLSDLTHRLRR